VRRKSKKTTDSIDRWNKNIYDILEKREGLKGKRRTDRKEEEIKYLREF